VPAEFLQREFRAVGELKTDERDENKNGKRHEQRQPAKSTVAEVGAAEHFGSNC